MVALPEGVSTLAPGDKCVLSLEHGLDVGSYKGIVEPAPDGKISGTQPVRMLRLATARDLASVAENAVAADRALQRFVQLLGEDGVWVKPLSAHYTLGREHLLFVFGAPDYIDCRRIVGNLQRELKTRIEVRHAGVRDEAAAAGGLGPCGRSLCCATWLRHIRTVNVRMVKAQDLAVNPAVINGCCGRLKCCLRYEYDVPGEATRGAPGKKAIELGTVLPVVDKGDEA